MPRPQLQRTKPLGGAGKGIVRLTFKAELEGAALTAALDHALPGPATAKMAALAATGIRKEQGTTASFVVNDATSSDPKTLADLVWRSPDRARLLGERVRALLADEDRISSECRFDGPTAAAASTSSGSLPTAKTGDGTATAGGGGDQPAAAGEDGEKGTNKKTGDKGPSKGALALAAVLDLVGDEPRVEVDGNKLRDLVQKEVAAPLAAQFLAEGTPAVPEAAASGTRGDGDRLRRLVSVHDEKGSRSYMEDKFCVCEQLTHLCGVEGVEPTAFFAVYDGHSGKRAAAYARQQLYVSVARDPAFATDLTTAVTRAYRLTDARFSTMASRDNLTDGATCVTLVIRGSQLVVHWCGDSEALLSRGATGWEPMGPTHTPARPDEQDRIKEAGGTVVWYGTWRVNGTLGVARSLGDVAHAGIVTAEPDARVFDADSVAFVLLASDGLFDVISHADAVNIVRAYQCGLHGGGPSQAAGALIGEALRRRTKDNVTALVVYMSTDGVDTSRPPRPERPRLPGAATGTGARDTSDAASAAAATAADVKPAPLPFKEDFEEARLAAGDLATAGGGAKPSTVSDALRSEETAAPASGRRSPGGRSSGKRSHRSSTKL